MGERRERKYMAHFINTTFGGGTTKTWERLGEDLEEFNVEMNPMITVERSILDEDYVYHDGYEPTASASPIYARAGSQLANTLQGIIDGYQFGNACLTDILEVHLWDPYQNITGAYHAVMRRAWVGIDSYGGDTSGYQIPFTLTIQARRVTYGYYKPSNNTFTQVSTN